MLWHIHTRLAVSSLKSSWTSASVVGSEVGASSIVLTKTRGTEVDFWQHKKQLP